jgi:N-acetylglucosamine malate deacetylase 1
MKLDILAFGAHPDDIEISSAGMLISEVKKGRKVGLVDLTLGEMGTRGTPELRLEEAADAAKIIGASMRTNLRMPDTRFEITDASRAQIINLIRIYQPEIVITNAPSDRHPDHGRASSLVVESCFLAGLAKWQYEGISEHAWRPKAVYQYMQFYQHVPHFTYDISDFIDQKMDSIKAHRSQFWDPNSKEPETLIASKHFLDNIQSRASEYGLQAGFAYGEPFIALRTLGVNDLFSLK